MGYFSGLLNQKRVFSSGGATPSWVIVQTNLSSATTQVQAMPSQVHTAGNMLLVGVYTTFGSVTVSSISNTAGDTWSLCTGSRVTPDDSLEWWSTPATAGSATDVVTVTLSTARNASIVLYEVSGQAASSPFETAATGTATGTTVTSASFSPAASGNLNLALMAVADGFSGTWGAGADYTIGVAEGAGNNIGSEYRSNAPSGSQTGSATFPTSRDLRISIVSIKPLL